MHQGVENAPKVSRVPLQIVLLSRTATLGLGKPFIQKLPSSRAIRGCQPYIRLRCRGCSGAGTRGTASPTFFDRGTRPPLPHFLD